MKRYFFFGVIVVLCIGMTIGTFAKTENEHDWSCIEYSIEYLFDMSDYETDIVFVVPVQTDKVYQKLVDITEDVVTKITEILDDKQEFIAADYPLYPDDGSLSSYMYWYNLMTKQCISICISLMDDEVKIVLSFGEYEMTELSWDTLPVRLEMGDQESIVRDALAAMESQYVVIYEDTELEQGCYTVFLPEHEELEYLQVYVSPLISAQMFQYAIEDPIDIPAGRVFSRMVYHWSLIESREEKIELIKTVHKTIGEVWGLEENAKAEGANRWIRYAEDVLENEPLFETDFWENELGRIPGIIYDQVDIDGNMYDGHVEMRYRAETAVIIELVKTWMGEQVD